MGAPQVQPVSGSDEGLRDALLAAQLPVEDLTDDGRRFFRFELEGQPVGYAGFEAYGTHALVRSVVVVPELRGKGVGSAIVASLIERLAAEGCSDAYLLTTNAAGFFDRLGFRVLDRASAPADILATRQAASICSTATLLARHLDD